MQPFRVELEVTGLPPAIVTEVVVSFAMAGMDMGLNRYRLDPGSEPGRWRGQVTLPICSSGRTDWLAQISATTRVGRLEAAIPFSTL